MVQEQQTLRITSAQWPTDREGEKIPPKEVSPAMASPDTVNPAASPVDTAIPDNTPLQHNNTLTLADKKRPQQLVSMKKKELERTKTPQRTLSLSLNLNLSLQSQRRNCLRVS